MFAYAILKYQLMDIRLAITRFTLFFGVYTLVLGVPFWIGFATSKWVLATALAVFLASVGPHIYSYLRKQAEQRFMESQRKSQATLHAASLEMGRIKDLRRLLDYITGIIMEHVDINHCGVYLRVAGQGHYVLPGETQTKISADSMLIARLAADHKPIILEELKHRGAGVDDENVRVLIEELEALKAELVVPVFLGQNLLAVIILGPRQKGALYTPDDLNVFSILANQAALAIENAQFQEERHRTQEQLYRAEKLAYVGQLASSVAHEIRNPLSCIKTFLEYLPEKYTAEDFRAKFDRLVPGEIARIENIVNQLLELSRQPRANMDAVDLIDLIDGTLELLETNFQAKEIEVKKEYDSKSKVHVRGHAEQLRQVFMNLFLNAVQAMDMKGVLTIGVREEPGEGEGKICIVVQDTGCGMTEEVKANLFKPFHTTKANGIGLGMVIVKEIIDAHRGTITVESREGEGTEFTITLRNQ